MTVEEAIKIWNDCSEFSYCGDCPLDDAICGLFEKISLACEGLPRETKAKVKRPRSCRT